MPWPWTKRRAAPPVGPPVNMTPLLAQHRALYTIQTPLGSLVLRHLPQQEAARIAVEIRADFPGFDKTMEELALLTDMMLHPVGLKPKDAARFQELWKLTGPFVERLTRACFVDPPMPDQEHLDALFAALPRADGEKLQLLLAQLAAPTPTPIATINVIALCKEFNIPLAHDLTAENLTVGQLSAMREALETEAIQTKQYLEDVARDG